MRDTTLSEPLLIGLSRFNFGRFPSAVVVARDLRAENARLRCRLPGYVTFAAEYAPEPRIARLVTLNDSSLTTDRCDRPAAMTSPRPPA